MPSRIPLRIADRDFRSNNQARIHYRDILHRYQPGDRQAVSATSHTRVHLLPEVSPAEFVFSDLRLPTSQLVKKSNTARLNFSACSHCTQCPHLLKICKSAF